MEAIENKEEIILAAQTAFDDMEREYVELVEDDEYPIIY